MRFNKEAREKFLLTPGSISYHYYPLGINTAKKYSYIRDKVHYNLASWLMLDLDAFYKIPLRNFLNQCV